MILSGLYNSDWALIMLQNESEVRLSFNVYFSAALQGSCYWWGNFTTAYTHAAGRWIVSRVIPCNKWRQTGLRTFPTLFSMKFPVMLEGAFRNGNIWIRIRYRTGLTECHLTYGVCRRKPKSRKTLPVSSSHTTAHCIMPESIACKQAWTCSPRLVTTSASHNHKWD